MKRGLVLIDIQLDYFDGGNFALPGMLMAARNSARLLAEFRRLKLPVFHVQHIDLDPTSTFLAKDTPGIQISPLVAPVTGESVIQKAYPNSFRGSSLQAQLEHHQVDTVVICGAMSNVCVDSTARAAFDQGFSVTVVEDCCAACSLEFKGEELSASQVHKAFMASLEAAAIAVVLSCEQYLKRIVAEP